MPVVGAKECKLQLIDLQGLKHLQLLSSQPMPPASCFMRGSRHIKAYQGYGLRIFDVDWLVTPL